MNPKKNIPIHIKRRIRSMDKVINNMLPNMYPCDYYSAEHFIVGLLEEMRWFLIDNKELRNIDRGSIEDYIQEYKYDELAEYYNERCMESKDDNIQESVKRILRENLLKNNLMNLINDVGIKKASKAVGGVSRLIKILDLNDEEINDFIYLYLTEGFYPDYNWGPELHDFYRKEIEQYGVYEFLINDVPAYAYLGEWDGYDYLYTLSITKWAIDELTTMFGDKWIPVFKKWFENNSGLEVREIDLKNKYNVL